MTFVLDRDHGRRSAPLVVVALVATACAGGGSEDLALSVQAAFATSSSLVTEGSSTSLSVRLDTQGQALPSEVSLTVRDTLRGSATSDVDYAAVPPTLLTFPAGSPHGELRSIDLDTLGDLLVEGAPETIVLEINDPTGTLVLGGSLEHVLQIQDDDLVEVQFVQGSSTTPEDAGMGPSLEVEALFDPGESLERELEVTVTDSGQGSATPGSDFSFANQVVTLRPGEDPLRVTIDGPAILDDAEFEYDETVVLGFSSGSNGVKTGPQGSYELTILGNDLPQEAWFELRAGPQADLLVNLEVVELGSASSEAPIEMEIQIRNPGMSPLEVGMLTLQGDTRDFHIAAPRDAELDTLPNRTFPLAATHEDPDLGVFLHWDEAAAAGLATLDAVRMSDVHLPGGLRVEVELSQRPLPLAKDAALVVDGVPAPGGLAGLLPGLTLWSGKVVGFEDSTVFLALSKGSSVGWIDLGTSIVHEKGRYHLLSLPAAGGRQLLLVPEESLDGRLNQTPGICGGELLPAGAELMPPGPTGQEVPVTVPGFTLPVCELAIETDRAFFDLFGSATDAGAYVSGLVGAASLRYQEDVQTRLEIAYLSLYTSGEDPWTENVDGGDLLALLEEFRGTWGPSSWPSQADLAHFLTGSDLGGGVAYVDALCDSARGFGVSSSLSGTVDWSLFPGPGASSTGTTTSSLTRWDTASEADTPTSTARRWITARATATPTSSATPARS